MYTHSYTHTHKEAKTTQKLHQITENIDIHKQITLITEEV